MFVRSTAALAAFGVLALDAEAAAHLHLTPPTGHEHAPEEEPATLAAWAAKEVTMATAEQPPAAAKRFEYHVLTPSGSVNAFAAEFDTLGAEGWALVGGGWQPGYGWVFVFIREVRAADRRPA